MDAVRDLDDPLTMVHLFATLPAEKLHGIPAAVVQTSRRLALEWQVWRHLAMSRGPCFLGWTESVHVGIANPSEPVNPAVYEWHGGQTHATSGLPQQAAQKPCSAYVSG